MASNQTRDRESQSHSDDSDSSTDRVIPIPTRPERQKLPKVRFEDEVGLPVTTAGAHVQSNSGPQNRPQKPRGKASAKMSSTTTPRPRGRPRKHPLPETQPQPEPMVVRQEANLPNDLQFHCQADFLSMPSEFSTTAPSFGQPPGQTETPYPSIVAPGPSPFTDFSQLPPSPYSAPYPPIARNSYPDPGNIANAVYPSVEQPEESVVHPFMNALAGKPYRPPLAYDQSQEEGISNEDDDDDDDEDSNTASGSDVFDEYGQPIDPATRGLQIRGIRPLADVDRELADKDRDYDEDEPEGEEDQEELSLSDKDEEQVRPVTSARGRGRGRPRGSGLGRGRGGRGGRKGHQKRTIKRIDENLGVRPRGRGGRGRGRRKMLANDEEESITRSWVRGPKPGTRAAVAPDSEFQQLYTRATRAYVDGDLELAQELLQSALRLNPEQHSAHSLLGEIYLNSDDKEKAAMSFFMGAYSNHREHDVWRQTAELLTTRIGTDVADAREFAIYCYRQAVNLDKDDIQLRRQRAKLLHLSKYLRKAANDFKIILKEEPCDTDSLQSLAEICVRKRWASEAIPYFESALPDGHEHGGRHDCGKLSWTHANLLADLQLKAGVTLEGLGMVKRLARALLGRSEETWWDDIADDSEFDAKDEPRRIKVNGFVADAERTDAYGMGIPIDLRMKMGIMRLRMGEEHFDEAMEHFSWFPVNEEGESIEEYVGENVDIYMRIAGNFFATEHWDVALEYYMMLQLCVGDMAEVHMERIAVCYEKVGRYEEAEEIYKGIMETVADDQVLLEKLAAMFTRASMEEKAAPYMLRLIEYRRKKVRLHHGIDDSSYPALPGNLTHPDPEDDQAEPADEREEEEEDPDDDDEIPLPEGDIPDILREQLDRAGLAEVERSTQPGKRKRRMARVAVTEHDVEHVTAVYAELTALEAGEGSIDSIKEKQWLDLTTTLLDEFRKQGRVFFPKDRHARFWGYDKHSRQRAQLNATDQEHLVKYRERMTAENNSSEIWPIPSEFCSIPFTRWFELFLNSALILAKQGKGFKAYDMCREAASANVFVHDPDRIHATRNVRLLVALLVGDDEQVTYIAREYMKDDQFTGDAYRLFIASNLALPEPNRMWNSSVNQKFILRQIKALDQVVAPDKERSGYSKHLTRIDRATGLPAPHPTELNPELLMLYAQMLYTGGSHTEALNYLHRVHALCPEDPLTHLLMGLCYIGWAFKRQSSNRHYLIAQGLTMFDRYRELRLKEGGEQDRDPLAQEVEYNVGRVFQNLGLTHLSVPCYERCLEMGDEMREKREEKMDVDGRVEGGGGGRSEEEDFTTEAALALKGIWAMNGQVREAERLMEKYLVL